MLLTDKKFKQEESLVIFFIAIMLVFKVDRLQMIVVAKKYICVATVHQ